MLFFVAHPDDTIACAGTMFLMKDRFELHVGVLTHGERGLGEKGYRDGSTKATRTKEEEAAAAMVGVTVTNVEVRRWTGGPDHAENIKGFRKD